MKKSIPLLAASLSLILIVSCSPSIPEGAMAVSPFDSERYLGKWYEIARIDFKHEKGLNNTTAEYSMKKDGSIKVDNKGYNVEKQEWEQAIGKAKFVEEETLGRLKVSFFGPFYSGYNVIAIDDEYQYALVAGQDLDYLWILSRNTELPEDIKKDYLEIARGIGYDTDRLLWIEHNGQQ
jgi:apolipoprotein D and lipocalin family protein